MNRRHLQLVAIIVALGVGFCAGIGAGTSMGRRMLSPAARPDVRAEAARLLDSLGNASALTARPDKVPAESAGMYASLARSAVAEARFWRTEANARKADRNTLLRPVDIDVLGQFGLVAPAESLRASLRRHTELVPRRPDVVDGSRVIPQESVILPGGQWVCARFEGEAGSGYLLLEYSVAQGGEIKWTRVAMIRH